MHEIRRLSVFLHYDYHRKNNISHRPWYKYARLWRYKTLWAQQNQR